ncbi:chromosome partitioning protein, ParB family [Roseivivax halotolerans]|uniref:Chromosome partitioning protein, ParB family n=1 Tax=Roseivivax halotolerans TaxID=93684 RepID=A0A1I6ANC7_9RHOB|nr:ParB/Srx family N-terminal domain-containing protein [Roseivivax halotolerans]SFQ70170.1 chromosome partitioning protein, ParB family [Roseivivax halotolerans]
MTKQTTITADEARFPLSKLVLSPMNPRQNVPAAEVEELAESIWTAGLIQNLAGIMDGKGGAEIVAGGRRLRALQLLAERHADLAQVRPELANPPVRIAPDDSTAQAWAVAENAARRDLHPADEIRAYGKMERSGATPAKIARAFAVTEKSVYRRLALAGLPDAVIDALSANEINLSAAACFTVSSDEARSLEVLEQCKGRNWSDYQIKKALKPDAVKETDRRAKFVGIEAYKAAGGRVGSDLFAEETLLDDPDILDAVFAERLAEVAENHERDGWKWVEASQADYLAYWFLQENGFARIYKEQGDLSPQQSERYDELAELAEADALDEAGEEELAALNAITEGDFTETQRAHSGIIIYVDSRGEMQTVEGLIRKADKAEAIAAGVLAQSQHGADDGPKSPISQKLRDDLGRVSRGARQHAALRDPDLLIDLLAYQLSHNLYWSKPFGLSVEDVPNWPTTEADGYALDERLTENPPRDMYGKDLGKSFRAFRQKGADHIRGELVRFLAAQLRGGDEKLAALIEKETQPNTREVWTPTAANFFGRVGGPYMVDLWRDLLDLSSDHPTATTFEKLKKGEKAAKLEALFRGDHELRSALGVTDEQAEKIAAWLPEGME